MGRSSISKARSYKVIGKFWDTHDLADYWEQTQPVEFEVDIQSEVAYYPLDITLAAEVCSVAKRQGYLQKRFSTCGYKRSCKRHKASRLQPWRSDCL